MTPHLGEETLNDYLDRCLPPDEAAAAASHLAVCPECRLEYDALRRLNEAVEFLPRQMAPRRDLWDGVADRISKSRLRTGGGGRRLLPALAAAAALLVVASSAATLWVVDRLDFPDDEELVNRAVQMRGHMTRVAFGSTEQEYEQATRELAAALEARGDQLTPETVRLIEENLQIIDEALRKSREALESDPSNARLSDLVVATYQKKVEFLQLALSL